MNYRVTYEAFGGGIYGRGAHLFGTKEAARKFARTLPPWRDARVEEAREVPSRAHAHPMTGLPVRPERRTEWRG